MARKGTPLTTPEFTSIEELAYADFQGHIMDLTEHYQHAAKAVGR